MQEFIAGEAAFLKLEKSVEKIVGNTAEPYGVGAVTSHEYLTVTEITLSKEESVIFRHSSELIQGTNTIILTRGKPFRAEIVQGHTTVFRRL